MRATVVLTTTVCVKTVMLTMSESDDDDEANDLQCAHMEQERGRL